MPKGLCISGMAIAGLLLFGFGLDLALGFPFGGISTAMDVTMVLSSLMLGYVSWATMREQI